MSKKFICLTAIGLMLAIAGSAGAQLGKGKVLFEYWLNINSGTSVDNDLRTNANFPNNPTQSEWRDSFKSKVDWADNAGTRARAYLAVPADGNYTFWVSGDDNCQLWLSTDDTAANAKMIAQVVGWSGAEEWANATEKANQVSVPQALKAGKVYYIEALEKEGGGGDSVSVGWAGPVIGDKTVVIAGQYLTAFIRNPEPLFKAQNPDPANGKTEVTNPLFTWTPGVTAVSNEVYCGTNPTPGPAEFMGPWPSVSPTSAMFFYIAGLTPGAKYYWRVDEVDAAGAKIIGDVWSFTAQPLEAHNPSPVDGALWRKTTLTLSVTAGQGAVKHRPFFGTDKAAVTAGAASVVQADQAAATLSVSGLQPNTVYYWRVDELDSAGKVLAAGPVWSFSTIDAAGGATAEYFNNATLSGMPAVVKTVPEINFNWGSGTVKGTNSPDAAIVVDYFSARFTAQLNVPVSGQYTFYCVSDDGARLFLNGTAIVSAWTTSGTSAAQDLVAGQSYVIVMESYENTGGATAQLSWSGPGIAKDIIPQGALQLPQVAISPNPGNNAVEVADNAVMAFTPGPKSLVNTMYFGTDKAKVTAGDKSVALPPSATASYTPAAPLTWNTTYYWKVDGMGADGSTIAGLVWSFTTANWIPVQAAQVSLTYDNTLTKAPFVSQLAFDVTGDLTRGGVTDLALRFQGLAKPAVGGAVYNDANGVYKVTGAGTDIWGTADAFQYVYKTLTGDTTIIARVVSNGTGANGWAKGGVMVRQSLAANSAGAYVGLTGSSANGNGACFQNRATAGLDMGANDATSNSTPAAAINPPYWVKLERKGNDFSGSISADGKTWTQLGIARTVVMADPVCIGLFVTSHVDAATVRTFTIDNVATTGTVAAGAFTATQYVGRPAANDPSTLYVAVEDQAGKMAMVTNANPAAVNTTVMDLWRVPMSAFAGVDLKNAKTLYIGVGDGNPDGMGVMNFADVRIVKPVVSPDPAAIDVTTKGDPLVGFPNYAGAWPAAEVPANAIDNTTAKYLNFGGKVQPPSGFCVTPSLGYSVVTGLTFTAANDTPARDPIAFEIYGAHVSIDGPWTLIAKGAIDDFARPINWPRNWKGVTPIGFANGAAFAHYKVVFTSLQNLASANSMQIAEVELLGVPAAQPIILDVVRAGGYTETRDPIGQHDGNTSPLMTQAGGLKDGNYPYSDRTYPWNQTPKEFVGAEYIRTINSDKNVATMTMTVTLSRAATVAIAHDDRNVPAQAAVDKAVAAFAAAGKFVDTGLDVFIYESATVPARPLSVFSADLPAGTYVFAGEASGNTSYIIGAIEKK
jgi:hypothetical protein